MARDYKRAPRNKRRTRRSGAGGSRLLWLAGGLLGGLILGFAGYWLTTVIGKDAITVVGIDNIAALPTPSPTPAPPAAKPVAPAKTAKEPAPARFDFYTLLPEMEVEITDDKLNEALQALPKSREQGPYILQVGSFRRPEEADSMKAQLALLGIESQIQTVIIRDDNVWYRVRVGPYENIRDLAQVRNRLNRNHIQFMLLRLGT